MVSASSYSPFVPQNEEMCTICHRNFPDDFAWVAHNFLHPVHQACAREWILQNNSCPVCRAEIDSSSVFNWEERAVIALGGSRLLDVQSEIPIQLPVGFRVASLAKIGKRGLESIFNGPDGDFRGVAGLGAVVVLAAFYKEEYLSLHPLAPFFIN